MALVIYSNGIFEEYLPVDNTFEESELAGLFEEYKEIRTIRLAEVPNCWLVWAEMDDPPENEFNKFASEMLDEDIYSHIVFVHDSELNRDWNVTDDILYKSYQDFIAEVGVYIKGLVEYIANETQKEYEAQGTTAMVLITPIGPTEDKRVLYHFDPDNQIDDFYKNGWNKFAHKVIDYLRENFDKEPIEKDKPFVLFADNKNIVITDDDKVNQIIDNLLKEFQRIEDYETCSFISYVREQWFTRKTVPQEVLDPSIGPPKKRRGRPPKKKDD